MNSTVSVSTFVSEEELNVFSSDFWIYLQYYEMESMPAQTGGENPKRPIQDTIITSTFLILYSHFQDELYYEYYSHTST